MAVYFIAEEGTERVKIGHSHEVWRRLAELQTHKDNNLILMCVIEGDREEERRVQRRFKDRHIRGEWFTYCDEMFDVGRPIDIGPRYVRREQRGEPLGRRNRSPEVQRAISAAGGVSKLAAALGIKPPSIYDWTHVPSHRIAQVSDLTGISVEDLLPKRRYACTRNTSTSPAPPPAGANPPTTAATSRRSGGSCRWSRSGSSLAPR